MSHPVLRSASLPLIAALALAATPGAAQKGADDAAKDAITAPLEDANIARKKTPAVLERIGNNPYSRIGAQSCAAVGASLAELNSALGPDFDDPPPPKDSDEAKAVSVAGSAALGLIPGRGVIREVSGANKAEARRARAIQAGIARRGFLKGVGVQLGCKTPAAPRS